MSSRTTPAVLMLIAFVACTDESPTAPTAPSGAEPHFTWTDDGQLVSVSMEGRAAFSEGATTAIIGDTCDGSSLVMTSSTLAEGAQYTYLTETLEATYRDGEGVLHVSDPFFTTGGLRVSSVSDDRVVGTFTLRFVDPISSMDSESIEGSFDIAFGAKAVC